MRYNPRANDVLFVSDLLNALQASLCVDPHRIYATGFSSGAAMSDLLACKLAGRIAAFAPVEGAYFPVAGCRPSRPAAILSFQGTGDPKVPYDTGDRSGLEAIPRWLHDWATRDGCTQGPSVFFRRADVTGERWTGCHAGAVLMHYRINGGSHAWPGAPQGTQTIRATPLIWQFFAGQRLG